MSHRRRFRLITLLALVLLALVSACGEDDGGPPVRTAGNGDEFNDADVRFATGMIQHHAQALALVDLTLGRELDPALASLAEQIRFALTPEIELMTDWLVAWGEDIPETVRDHANAHGDGAADPSDLPGMVSPDEMAALEDARGDAFDQLWLELMIAHHGGAIQMARAQVDDGHHAAAVDLADSIIKAQSAEIATMESLLG